jgi:arsenite methyltransferase
MSAAPLASVAELARTLSAGDRKACCATAYSHPAVRWLLGGELHPGGEATTRRALELIAPRPGERLLDVASGAGTSAILAARELGCDVVGVEYGADAVREAQVAADDAGVGDRVGFVAGDAEALPFDDREFDAVLCECSLCTFADKRLAVAEIARVLRPGGRFALADVVADRARLPGALAGALATIACVGEALSPPEYEELLTGAGLHVTAYEYRGEDAARLAERVHDRLRGARLLGFVAPGVGDATELVAAARRSIGDGALGYAIFAASR